MTSFESILSDARTDVTNKRNLAALQKVYRVLRHEPTNIEAITLLYQLLLEAGDHPGAEKAILKLIAMSPTLENFELYGRFLMADGKYSSALNHFKKSEDAGKIDIELMHAIGFCYLKTSDYEKALNYYSRIEQEGYYFENMGLIMGELYFEKKEYERVIEIVHKAIQFEGEKKDYLILLADANLMLERWTQALKYYKSAQAFIPDDFKLCRSIGWTYCNLRNFKEGIKHLKKAIKLNPYYIEGHLSLALAYIEIGDLDKGLEEFQNVLKFDPGNTLAKEYVRKISKNSNS